MAGETVVTTNVTTGKPKKTGAMFWAPSGTSAPTDATTTLSNTFKGLGYVSDGGLTNSGTIETQQIRAWGGDVVYDAETSKTDQFRYVLIEALSTEVLKLVHGDTKVTGTLATGITVSASAEEHTDHVFVVDMVLRGNVAKRIVIPNGKVIAVGDVVYVDNGSIGYDVTISATPDASGNTHYEYMKTVTTTSSGG